MLTSFAKGLFFLLKTIIQIPSSVYYLVRTAHYTFSFVTFVLTEYLKHVFDVCFLSPLCRVFLSPKIKEYYYPFTNTPKKELLRRFSSSLDVNYTLSPTKPLLILDLDGTIIYTKRRTSFDFSHNYDLTATQKIDSLFHNRNEFLSVDFFNTFIVYYRPFINYFIKSMSKFYKIVIFTTSLAKYADPILDKLASSHLIFKRYYRAHCIRKKSKNGKVYYQKNLDFLKFEKNQMIILDDTKTFGDEYLHNWIPIGKYNGNKKDTFMRDCIPFLLGLRYIGDVREILKYNKLFGM